MSAGVSDPQLEVTAEDAAALREAGELSLLLDVRTPMEVETASIDGATVVPMSELDGRVDELAEHQDKKVVVFCHGGVRSLKVTQFLRDQGFDDSWSMAGGIDAWSQRVDPSVPRY